MKLSHPAMALLPPSPLNGTIIPTSPAAKQRILVRISKSPQISYWVLTYILQRYGFGIIFYPSFDFWHRPLNLPSFRIGHPSNTRRMLSHILWLDEMDSRNSIGRRDSLNNYLMGSLYLLPICAKRQQLLPTQHLLQHPRSSAK